MNGPVLNLAALRVDHVVTFIASRFQIPDYKLMHHLWTRSAALWLSLTTIASVASAQIQPVGFVDQVVANPTQTGSRGIAVRVYYPASASGQNTTMSLAPSKGYPVVVWMGGFGRVGHDYPSLCNFIAGNGYVVVALDSTTNDLQLQRDDGMALFPALKQVTEDPRARFHGAFDMRRVALAGHSMGGGNVVRVLAKNPGYRMGVGYAAWQGPVINGVSFPHQYAKDVKVPMLLLHGEGDTIIPWKSSAKLYQDRLVNTTKFAVLHRMNSNCDHANLVSLLPTHAASMQVFFESMNVTLAALKLELGEVRRALDGVVGEIARGHAHFADQDVRLERAAVWAENKAQLGQRVVVKAVGGKGELFLAAGVRGQLSTPWGTLGIKPASLMVLGQTRVQRLGDVLSHAFTVPRQRSLIGLDVCFQAISLVHGLSDRLVLTAEEGG